MQHPYPSTIGQPLHARPLASGARSPGLAFGMELLLGGVFQLFGLGHIYAGRPVLGMAWLLGYMLIQAVNIALMGVVIGFITLPLTWLVATVIASISAAATANQTNEELGLPI